MNGITAEQLRANALLGAIIDATVQLRFGGLVSVEWDGDDCHLDDHQDTAGTLRFVGGEVVGAFCDVEGAYRRSWLAENQEHLYRGMPSALREVAEGIVRTHPHMLVPVGSEDRRLASAVLWSEGGRVTAAVPWPEFMENTGQILRNHFPGPEEAFVAWTVGYGLTPAEAEFARRVFGQKRAAGGGPVELSDVDAQWVEVQSRSLAELRSCLHCFSGIEVAIPVRWERITVK